MTQKESLHEIISTLINQKAEGVYWDFKCKHHESNEKLIHDILCLANAKHSGDRFLIFGVDAEDFSLRPITNDDKRKTQANFADLFRANANKFFQSRFPEFYLQEMNIDGIPIDVLVIKNTSDKPYYLVKKCHNLPAHHIYSRVCDTNTPIDETAQPHEIERMWRERFGLDMPPLERAKRYLSEPKAWSPLVENISSNAAYYYTSFPEFTLRVASAEAGMACHEEWTRGELRTDNNHAGFYELRYHQTLLDRIRYVSFDDHKMSMVAPDYEPRGGGRFYFYETDSIEYAVQKFFSSFVRGARDDSQKLSIRGQGQASDEARSRWGHNMKIPVLRTGELEGFLGHRVEDGFIEVIQDEAEQYQIHLRNQLDFEEWRLSQGQPIL
ncbi:MAG: ATP-binding protein [Paracoccaceae bacterium]|nr:ATP-binding protein [Nitrospira sp.]MDE2917714.1 ATP-binding protein [Paracoccaceae bacterium]